MDKLKKRYVNVIAKYDKDGNVKPLALSINNDKLYKIDKIKYVCRTASLRISRKGVRYTIKIKDKVLFLYDDENGRWFIDI